MKALYIHCMSRILLIGQVQLIPLLLQSIVSQVSQIPLRNHTAQLLWGEVSKRICLRTITALLHPSKVAPSRTKLVEPIANGRSSKSPSTPTTTPSTQMAQPMPPSTIPYLTTQSTTTPQVPLPTHRVSNPITFLWTTPCSPRHSVTSMWTCPGCSCVTKGAYSTGKPAMTPCFLII